MPEPNRAEKAARAAPASPGVYLFYSNDRQLLYVGKAKNLWNRVHTHFSIKLSPRPSRQKVAAASTEWLTWICTDTELHALVLEDVLIKGLSPIVNKQLKKWRSMCWILVEREKKVRMIRFDEPLRSVALAEKTVRYGPFKDSYFVEKLFQIGVRYMRIGTHLTGSMDTLSNSIPDMSEMIQIEKHKQEIDAIGWFQNFLEGSDTFLEDVLVKQISLFSAARRFEEAARLRDDLIFVSAFLKRREFIHNFVTTTMVVRDLETENICWQFVKGHLLDTDPHQHVALAKLGNSANADWILADRADVVYRWLAQNTKAYDFRFLP